MNLSANWSILLVPVLIGAALASVVLWYVWRSLFGDRPRSGPRCLKCDHPFIESQSLTCVECGWTARRPSDLTRPRRHWIQATLGIAALLAGAILVRLRTTGQHPIELVPDPIMVRLLPLGTGLGGDAIHDEIARRLAGGEFSPGSLDTLVRSLLAGDRNSPPVGDAWQVRYGPLLDRWRRTSASPANPLTAELLRLPADATLEVPTAWPSASPIPARLSLQDWWPPGTETVVDLRWASRPDAPPLHSVGYRNDASIVRRHQLTLPPAEAWPDPPVLSLSFRDPRVVRLGGTEIDRGPTAAGTASMATSTLTPPIGLPEARIQAWPGDASSTKTIEAVFRPGMQRWRDAVVRPYAMRFDPSPLAEPRYDDVLFGMVVEVLETPSTSDPIVHRRTDIWAVGGTSATIGRRIAWDISEEDTDALAGAFDPETGSTWSLRITGREDIARRALGLLADRPADSTALRWWSGSITLPLRTTTRDGDPFRRMWFRQDGVQPPRPGPGP